VEVQMIAQRVEHCRIGPERERYRLTVEQKIR
jgi:hypothetical protein